MSKSETDDVVEILGKQFAIERHYLGCPDAAPFYGCGILPLRANRADLIRDIEMSQGPEWRR